MDFQDEDIKEFVLEATELLDIAEQSLLAMDGTTGFQANFDAVFRAFHSIKGASGMMQLSELQAHMHQLENSFTQFKTKAQMDKNHVDFFLRGVDGARQLLEGKKISFNYSFEQQTSAPAAVPQAASPAQSPAAVQPAVRKTPTPEAAHSKGVVMVIDDEPDIADILADILKSEGLEVVTYTDPTKAVADLAKVKPYVVLSDFSMPKLTGMQVLEKVYAFDADIPLIFVSGYITKEVLLESLALGIYGVVEKPFDAKKILQITLNAYRRYEIQKLLNRSIKLVTYQYSDLDDYLKTQGKEEIRKLLSNEVNQLLTQQRNLKSFHKKAA